MYGVSTRCDNTNMMSQFAVNSFKACLPRTARTAEPAWFQTASLCQHLQVIPGCQRACDVIQGSSVTLVVCWHEQLGRIVSHAKRPFTSSIQGNY
ncbi:unnamed protein product [Darwinula stevensoni]|uniref:Uncharacterized protein n=1 Tax=Darwinula stevensoni TaxID=69355 RepID=A0A7R9FSX2_9CRUS|nr:unnamed protein product [Darwinula stevensoni]CAG0904399.1 unnamed protein product [Darwinula stevensoni]